MGIKKSFQMVMMLVYFQIHFLNYSFEIFTLLEVLAF